MREDPTLKWRDGGRHTIGPLALQFSTAGGEPHGEAEISTADGITFLLDWLDAEAIAFAIEPSADFWLAADSDRHGKGHGEGWLRLYITSDTSRLGLAAAWAGAVFQTHRIVTGAGPGERVAHPRGERSPDYRRKALKKHGGAASTDTRQSFLNAAAALARLVGSLKDAPAEEHQRWEAEAASRLRAADLFATEKLNMEKETDQ